MKHFLDNIKANKSRVEKGHQRSSFNIVIKQTFILPEANSISQPGERSIVWKNMFQQREHMLITKENFNWILHITEEIIPMKTDIFWCVAIQFSHNQLLLPANCYFQLNKYFIKGRKNKMVNRIFVNMW